MEKDNKGIVNEVKIVTSSDFQKHGINSLITEDDFDNFDELKEYLAGRIVKLLETNYDRLLNALYLIDVEEDKFKAAFKENNPEKIPYKIADLVIEREMQKVMFRKKYKENTNNELLE